MKKISINIFLVLFSLLTLSSCLLEDEKLDFGNGPIVVQFPKSTADVTFFANGKVRDYIVPVQYFGGKGLPLDKDVTATIEVDPSSVAKDGVEVTIPSKEIHIPAGSNSGNLLIQVNTAKLSTTKAIPLVIKIKESSETASNNRGTMKINLTGICASALAGNYYYTSAPTRNVTVKSVDADYGDGSYRISRDNAFASDYGFIISDVCGKLTVIDADLTGMGYAASGTGTVDPVTGTMVFKYTVNKQFTGRSMTLVKKP